MKINASTGEIFLYGVVGNPNIGGDFGVADVIDALESLGSQRAKVRINSPGGVVDEGVPIYNALKRHEGGVDVYVDGLAASIASVIAMAGQNRYTAKGSRWMIHRAWGFAGGNAAEIRKYADVLAAYDQSIEEIYSTAIGDMEQLRQMLDAETWFTGKAAIEIGLATGEEDEQAKYIPSVAAWFKNPPAEFIAACAKTAPSKPLKPLSQKFYSR